MELPESEGTDSAEQRVQVNARRFRIPDVCILAAGAGCQKIITTAPELCIEVLSPEDTLTRTMERVGDYFAMGVPTCWIIDPVRREAWIATSGHLAEVTDGVLRAGDVAMPLAEVLEPPE